jgi:hypothetical protein
LLFTTSVGRAGRSIFYPQTGGESDDERAVAEKHGQGGDLQCAQRLVLPVILID